MSDIGTSAIEDGAMTGTGAALVAADAGLNALTAKATLFVRLAGKNIDNSGSKISEDVSGLRSVLKKRNKSSSTIAKRAGQSVNQAALVAAATANKMTEAELSASMLSKGFLPFSVQYNPASLNLRTVGGRFVQYQSMGNENMNSLTATDKKTSTHLSVQLIYEAIENADAFGSSSLGVNADDVINTGKSVIKNLAGGGYSIKKQVEGLISLLMTKEYRQVIFVWNNMFFHGELISVNANFTMFNKLGNPIKATVDLEIQQSNGNAIFASDRQYWNEVFDEVYGL